MPKSIKRNRSWLEAAEANGLIASETAANANCINLIQLSSVDVPPPPSTNHLFLTTRHGKRVKTPAYRAWLDAAIPVLSKLRKPELPCTIYLHLIGKWNVQRDGSNTVKAIEDALVKSGAIPEDNLTVVKGVHWTYDDADCEPKVIVRFSS